jgi:hypothetical protein
MKRLRGLLAIHLAANALLLWLAYKWLSLDESTTARLILSGFDALAILCLACWLYGATMVWFALPNPRLDDSFRTTLRHLPPLVLLVIAALAIYAAMPLLPPALTRPSQRFAFWLTWVIRKPVKPALVLGTVQWALWAIRWIVLPVLLVPAAASIALHGWKGWRSLSARRPWTTWARIPLLTAAALWLPFALLNWKPKVAGFGMELASFGLRGGLAYLLFVCSVTWLAASAVRSKPLAETH